MILSESEYLSIFGVTRPLLERLVATALSDGGDYADLYFEDTWYRDLYLRDGVVASGGSHLDFGVGIRTLKGEKTGYAYTESTDPASMTGAARAAAAIARGAGPTGPSPSPESRTRRQTAIPSDGTGDRPRRRSSARCWNASKPSSGSATPGSRKSSPCSPPR